MDTNIKINIEDKMDLYYYNKKKSFPSKYQKP